MMEKSEIFQYVPISFGEEGDNLVYRQTFAVGDKAFARLPHEYYTGSHCIEKFPEFYKTHL